MPTSQQNDFRADQLYVLGSVMSEPDRSAVSAPTPGVSGGDHVRLVDEGRRAHLASVVVLVAGALAITGFFLLPSGGAVQDLWYSGVGVAACGVMIAGIAWRRPRERSGWTLLTAACGLFVAGDGVYTFYDLVLHRDAPFPSIADAIYLLGYPLLFLGVARVTRLGAAPGAREGWADAGMVSLGGLALSWHLLMGSTADDTSLSIAGRLVTLAYPVMDIGILFIIVSAMIMRSARRSADSILALAVAVMLVADFAYDLQVLHATYSAGGPTDGMFLANYVLMAAAAIHPSVAAKVPAPAGGQPRRPRFWLPLVAAASAISPVLLVVCSLAGVRVDVPVLALISVVLSALAGLRTSWLFLRLRDQAEQLAARTESLHESLAAQQALEEDLRHQAFHDNLTGLANRALLHDRIEHALATHEPERIALCFCDLDGFKEVNDTLGHATGDTLLSIAGKRIEAVVRTSDTVARLGGDEFAVLFCNVEDPSAVMGMAERIVSVLRQPVELEGDRIHLSASIGVAFAAAGASTQRLLADADAAMYEAKQGGKDRAVVFEYQMRKRIVDRMTLINAFSTSLREGRFFLEYQPQYSLSDGRLEGFEALLRWLHPSLGRVAPDQFIPVAEETGFIVPLGRWILEQACRQAAGWADRGSPVEISVNISGRQLHDSSLCNDVRAALAKTGLPPRLLTLEITETTLIADPGATAGVLAELRGLGVRIAIDDFGTGYSSLNSLRQLPADILKVDKSFVDPLTDPRSEGRAFVQMILRLARDLNLRAVAEGIEQEEQRAVLAELGCDSGQGYLMARPLSPEDAGRCLPPPGRVA